MRWAGDRVFGLVWSSGLPPLQGLWRNGFVVRLPLVGASGDPAAVALPKTAAATLLTLAAPPPLTAMPCSGPLSGAAARYVRTWRRGQQPAGRRRPPAWKRRAAGSSRYRRQWGRRPAAC